MPYRTLLLVALTTLLTLPAAAQSLHDLGAQAVPLHEAETGYTGKRAEMHVTSRAVEADYTGVLVRGTSADTSATGAVRFREGGAWGPWHPLRFVFSATGPTFVAGYRDETALRPGSLFQLRFETRPDAALTVQAAGVFDSRGEAAEHDAAIEDGPLQTPRLRPERVTATMTPRVVRRNNWGAAPFRGEPVPLARPDYLYLTLHHAAGFSAVDEEDGKEQMRRIQELHQEIRGWSDIGYQFVVDRGGHLFQGRPFLDESQSLSDVPTLAMGAHVGGHNTGNIGLCVLGCYHPPEGSGCEQEMTQDAFDSIVQLFAWLCERYGLTPDDIRGHRDFGSTACPGDNNYALLDDLREAVGQAMAPSLAQAAFTAEVGEDGVVQLTWTFAELNGLAGYRIERIAGRDTTLLRRTSTTDGTLVDAATLRPGAVTYRLYGFNADGLEQLLAETLVAVNEPYGLVLASTFPNPFSDHASVRYYVGENAYNVRLTVYDALGREVALLASHEEPEPMWRTATLDAAGLASGTYYVRLTVDDFSGTAVTETRPMLLVR